MAARIHYDEEYDNLIISRKKKNEKVRENYLFDDFVISITGNGKIVGIEIKNAKGYLEEMGVNPEILDNVEKANLIVNIKRDFIYIGFVLSNKEISQKIPLANMPKQCINA